MSSIELLDLPDHILAKILSFIPDHFIAASVCQKFYELDCLNYRNKLEMRLKFSKHSDKLDAVFDSIHSSERVFCSMNIEFTFKGLEEFKNLKKILQQHGSTVKKLKLKADYNRYRSEFQLPAKELIELLKFFPELEKLDISMDRTRIVDEDAESSDKSPFLPKLKELAFSSGLMKFFTKNLPTNVKNVAEKYCYFSRSKEELIENLLKVLETRNLEKIRLKKIEPRKISFFTEFLRTQPNLKSLEILSNDLDEEPNYQDEIEFYNEVVKMKSLEHLAISEISRAFVEKFPKLKLKSLKIFFFDQEYVEDLDEDFRILTLSTLEKLVLPIPYSSHIFDDFELNFPLKSLKLESWSPDVNKVLTKFPHLESLEMKEIENECHFEPFTIYSADGEVFENLKHLSIFASSPAICNHNLMEMLKALPNLEKLHFAHVVVYKQKNFFADLKTNLPKIQELFLTLWIETEYLLERSTCDDLDCYPNLYYKDSSSEDESLEEKFVLNDAAIKALQKFSADEKLISFDCRINKSRNGKEYEKEVEALQGFFRCNVNSGSLTLKKGKAMKIHI